MTITPTRSPTMQAFFDTTVRALRAQGQAAMNSVDSEIDYCMYRAPNGRRCAAGLHIPDELYDPGMERKSISGVVIDWPSVRNYFPAGDNGIQLAMHLQYAHDNPQHWDSDTFSSDGINELRFIARRFALNAGVLDEVTDGAPVDA